MVFQLPAKVFGQDQLYNRHQPYLKFDMSGRGHTLAATEMHVFMAFKELRPWVNRKAGEGGPRENKTRRLYSWVCGSLLLYSEDGVGHRVLAHSLFPRQCHRMPERQRLEQSEMSLSVVQNEDGVGLAPHRTSLDLDIFNQPFLHASHAQVFMHKEARASRPVREPNYHSRPGVSLCGQVSCQNTGSSGLITEALLLQAPDHSLRAPALQIILSAQSHPPRGNVTLPQAGSK